MQTTKNKKLKINSWNPFTGCTKISPACQNCYAEALADKLNRWRTPGYENTFKFTVHHDRIKNAAPLKRKKPTSYFINSMSDTFHEDATKEDIDAVMDVVRRAHWHNFYILTKRSKRLREYFAKETAPDNLWVGVTVEDKKHGLPRLKDLQQIKCKNKHICCEPLLDDLGEIDLSQIKWVVGGGESGPNARQTKLEWVESLVKQCKKQHVHLYWKSWGTYGPDGVKRKKGDTDCSVNGKIYLSFPKDLMPDSGELF
ncbi:MAG: phage Gp37/Gp68 family protein [Alphaproteobacteria bacterium]|nr:phage Gp37/Gp68 family protein [Alphaproteobacteria bacterium]